MALYRVLAGLPLVLLPASVALTAEKNVVLFVTDDQGQDAGCYGNPAIKTPNLDRLAHDGTLFKYAFCTTASCSARPVGHFEWVAQPRQWAIRSPTQLPQVQQLSPCPGLAGVAGQSRLPHRAGRQVPRCSRRGLPVRSRLAWELSQPRRDGQQLPRVPNRCR